MCKKCNNDIFCYCGQNAQKKDGVSASFSNESLCDFTPDKRIVALHDRLAQYYKDTPDSMNNKDAMPVWREFNKWCNDRDYTREEVNYAKRNVRIDT